MAKVGSRIIKALEQAWQDIQGYHPELPGVVIVTGSGLGGRKIKWGHFWAGRWETPTDADQATQADPLPELFVSGQLLDEAAHKIMETLLHEAAHAVAHVRKVDDTNVNGRHNRKFAAIAAELGCEWPEGVKPHPTQGYSAVVISESACERYAATIAALEAARLARLTDLRLLRAIGLGEGDGESGGEEGDEGQRRGRGSRGGKGGGRRPNAVCGCPDPDGFPISRARLLRTPIMCGKCEQRFYHPDEDETAENVA
ncbi:SprT-like domain-containing protein [Crossiella sp. NPDC003009]